MGATSIVISARGKNMQDAFKNAKADAEEEYGRDAYNGEINNCSLCGDVTNKRGDFPETNDFHEWIFDITNKREVKGYCTQDPITNNNKIKTVVTNYPQKGTRKWVTNYIGVNSWEGDVVCESESQTECIKKARAYVEKNPKVKVEIQIRKVLIGGLIKVADITYKKASNERDGSYTFAGWAPE